MAETNNAPDLEAAKRHRDAKTAERRVYAQQLAELTGEPYVEPRPVPDAELDAKTLEEFEELQRHQAAADYAGTPEYAEAKARADAARGYIDAHRDMELTRQSAGLDPDPTYTAAQEQLAQAERDMQYDPDPGRAERFRQRLGL